MHPRTRRILPALLLASTLPLTLSACEDKGGSDKADSSHTDTSKDTDHSKSGSKDPGKGGGTGSGKSSSSGDAANGDDSSGSDVGPCDDKTHLKATLGGGEQDNEEGSIAIAVQNTGSKGCVLPKVLGLSISDENADLDVKVDVYNSDSEVDLGPGSKAFATLNYTVDPDAEPVDSGQLELDGIGHLAVDKTGGTANMSDGTVQLTAFRTS